MFLKIEGNAFVLSVMLVSALSNRKWLLSMDFNELCFTSVHRLSYIAILFYLQRYKNNFLHVYLYDEYLTAIELNFSIVVKMLYKMKWSEA